MAASINAGVTAVEFALIVPAMLLMFVGIADLGIGIYTNMQVQNAASRLPRRPLLALTRPDQIKFAKVIQAEIAAQRRGLRQGRSL